MGSCLSTNNRDTTESAKPKAVDVSTPVESTTSNPASITQVPASAPKSNSHPSHPSHPSHQSSPHRHHGHDDTEGMSDTSEEQLRVHPKSPVEQASSTAVQVTRTSERAPLTRVRSGYSSGGSSGENLEPTPLRDKSFDMHLSEWRVELSAEGNLPKSVVRIETDFGRPIEEVYDGVSDGEVLGSGVEGLVRLVKHKKTGVNFAVKCLNVGLIKDGYGLQRLRDEIFIMCQLDHPNIVRLEEVYEGELEIYLVQELCPGGDLFDRLDDQSDYHYSEVQCAKLVKQMLSTVRHLHSKKIVHRDLKLENFLFASKSPNSELKMIDFGLSKHFTHNGEVQHECVGTPYAVAPEVIRGSYDEKCDMWALGVITYLLLCGETPFGGIDGEPLQSVRNRILEGEVVFEPADLWEHVSDTGKNFVKRLLNSDVSVRPTAKQAQFDPWIQVYGKKNGPEGKKLSPNVANALLEFKEYSDMRKLLYEVLSYTLLPEQIVDLRQEFEKIDTDGDGEIEFCELKEVLLHTAEAGTLGALSEKEVEDIFNALRVSKSDKTIHWHEFIAATLSQCDYDERNLKLAFDRLDYDRKGFISFDDMMGLLGNEEVEREMRQIWTDALTECEECNEGRITYADFLMLVKGQPREHMEERQSSLLRPQPPPDASPVLDAVPEGSVSPQGKHLAFARFDGIGALDTLAMPSLGIPTIGETTAVNISFPPDIPLPQRQRNRSRSLGEAPRPYWEDEDEDEEGGLRDKLRQRSSGFAPPSQAIDELELIVKDQTKTAFFVHRSLFRKNHEMRNAVLEASRQFEKKRHTFKCQQTPPGRRISASPGANLVMRRGLAPSKEAIPKLMHDSWQQIPGLVDRQQQDLTSKSEHERVHAVEDASKRSGRPRRMREKTVSDIAGMIK